MESVHTYDYTVKIAGQVDKNWLDMFKYNLKKFDPIEMSEPKTTPIQKSPYQVKYFYHNKNKLGYHLY